MESLGWDHLTIAAGGSKSEVAGTTVAVMKNKVLDGSVLVHNTHHVGERTQTQGGKQCLTEVIFTEMVVLLRFISISR